MMTYQLPDDNNGAGVERSRFAAILPSGDLFATLVCLVTY
jgi:hypothetical protein